MIEVKTVQQAVSLLSQLTQPVEIDVSVNNTADGEYYIKAYCFENYGLLKQFTPSIKFAE